MAEENAASGAEQRLIDALRELIALEKGKPLETKSQVGMLDAIWLLLGLACVLFALYLLPEDWLKGEGWKIFQDKLLPWCLNLGALATIIKTPDAVLAATRNVEYRWIVGSCLGVLALLALPIFRFHADVKGQAIPYVDGARATGDKDTFALTFRSHKGELRFDGNPDHPVQKFPIGLAALTASVIHGFWFEQTWRAVYTAKIDTGDDDSLNICIRPKDFKFDDGFVSNSHDQNVRVTQTAAEYPLNGGRLIVDLPSGDYVVTSARRDCGVSSEATLKVGGTLEAGGTTLNLVRLGVVKCTNLPLVPQDFCMK